MTTRRDETRSLTRVLDDAGLSGTAAATSVLVTWGYGFRASIDAASEGVMLGVFRWVFALALAAFLVSRVVGVARMLRGDDLPEPVTRWARPQRPAH
jgi:hypothetical protein